MSAKKPKKFYIVLPADFVPGEWDHEHVIYENATDASQAAKQSCCATGKAHDVYSLGPVLRHVFIPSATRVEQL